MSGEKSYTLREANENDFEFVRTIHHRTLRQYIEPIWGWDECQQDDQVRKIYDPKKFFIIQKYAKDIGILATEDRGIELFFASISIIPEVQRNGIGSQVIQDIIKEAKHRKIPISLQVLKTNILAKKLYERLDFKLTSETNTHYIMKMTAI